MNSRSRRFLFGLTSLGLAASIAIPVFAAEQTAQPTAPRQNPERVLIQALATRFNLNQTDLQQFFTDQHTQQMANRLNEMLSRAVTNGRITEAQKALIIAKANELKPQLAGFQSLTPADRQTKIKQLRTDLEAWATQQGINKSFVRDILGGGFGGPEGMRGKGGPRGGHGMGMHTGMGKGGAK